MPKQRGIIGERLLENLLADIFPKEKYSLQFSIGTNKVDAVIFFKDKVIPIDAKFPLDNY